MWAARHVTVNHGRLRWRVDTVADRLGSRWWQRMSAGSGAKGPRNYDWACVGTDSIRWLLIRRNLSITESAYYLCWSPAPVPLATLVRIAGTRWAVEECFQTAKAHVSLDHDQVRGWTAWHRLTVLALLASAVLAACAATEPEPVDPPRPTSPLPAPSQPNDDIDHEVSLKYS